MYLEKNFLKFKKINLIFFISFFFLISAIFHQELSAQQLGIDSMEVTLVPEVPGANEEVKVRLNSYSFNIDSSEITVVVNGKIKQKEIGLKTLYFKTGDFGKKTDLKIIVKKVDGGIIEKSYSITPAEVDLIYQISNPHIPFGYKGKSTLLSNSELTVFAFPTLVNVGGQTISSDSLIYKWYKDFGVDLANSGFGKSTYKINRLDAFPRETRISVTVTSLDGKIVAKKSTVFKPQGSEVEFYALEDGLPFSFKNIASPNISSRNLDTEIMAVPYFMEGLSSGEVQYNWNINGNEFKHASTSDKNRIILANNTQNFIDKIKISLEIVNQKKVLQSLLEKSLSVNFLQRKKDESETFFSEGGVKDEGGFFDSF